MTRFARILAAPLVSVGIAAAGLGTAGTASAGITVNDDGSMVATPDTRAHQQMMYPGYYYWPTHAYGPHTDTTVHQSR